MNKKNVTLTFQEIGLILRAFEVYEDYCNREFGREYAEKKIIQMNKIKGEL